jgi:hypothetical protein
VSASAALNSETPAEPSLAAFGLVVGGLPTAYSKQTWRPCLWILASLAFAIAIVAFFVIPTDVVQTTDRRVDWVGAALVTVGLVFVQFVISDGETAPQGWKTSCERNSPPASPWRVMCGDWRLAKLTLPIQDIIALLIIGVFLVIAFFLWERHVVYNTTRPPLMRLQLWTRANGRLAAVYAIGCTSWMGFSVSPSPPSPLSSSKPLQPLSLPRPQTELIRDIGAVLPRDTLLSTGPRYRSDRGDAPLHPLLGVRRAVQRPRRQAHLQSPDAMDHLRWNPVHGVSSIVALARGSCVLCITCGGFIRIIVSVWSTCRAQC